MYLLTIAGGGSVSAAQPRLVLVHGSVANAEASWRAQAPLAARFCVEAPNRRGFPPGPRLAAVDFEDEAAWLAGLLAGGSGPAHLVGHSYGGVVALLAAGQAPAAVRSLTVIEPPAFGAARGEAAVEAIVAASRGLWARREALDERAFLAGFLGLMGGREAQLPDPLPADLAQGTALLKRERPPVEAVLPYAALRAAGIPVLCVSSGDTPSLEAVCDAIAGELGAERAVLPGRGHAVQLLGEQFNALLEGFVARAEAAGR